MGFLITDSLKGICLADGQGSIIRQLPGRLQTPCWPVASREHLVVALHTQRNCVCIHRGTKEEWMVLPALPGLGGMCLSPCGRYLYQLSTEADCVHTLHLGSGELCYAMPAGVFPRCMRLSQDGRQLLIAGGAVCEAYVLAAPELYPLHTLHIRHPCFAADFCKDGFALLCAAEGEELQTILYMLSRKGVKPRERLRLPGQPGMLRVCPDGETALISTPDGLMRVCLNSGELLWNRPEWALCMRIDIHGNHAILSDTLCGSAALLNLEEPWKQQTLLHGVDAHACYVPKMGKSD